MGDGLKKSVRYKAVTCKHSTMSSNIDQHHMLSIVDTLHEKYQFQDGECKEIVEALDGKKKPIDVENAQFVVIKFDRLMIEYNEVGELPEIVANYNEQSLCEVCAHVPYDEHWYHQTHYKISQSALKQLAEHHSEGCLAPSRNLGMKFRVVDIEVLATRE